MSQNPLSKTPFVNHWKEVMIHFMIFASLSHLFEIFSTVIEKIVIFQLAP